MPDIFDQVAGSVPAASGDIFDQVAAQPKPQGDIFDQVATASPSGPARGTDAWYLQKIGGLVPESATPVLSWLQQHINAPLDAMAKKGAEVGGNLLESIAANPGVPSARVIPVQQPTLVPQAQFEQEHPVLAGASKGVGEVAGGTIADPRNWPFLAGSAARPLLQRVISGGFATMMGKSAIDAAQNLHDNWDQLTPAQRSEMITQSGLSAAMAGGAAFHAAGETEIPEDTTTSPSLSDTKPLTEVPAASGDIFDQVAAPVAKTTGMEAPSAVAETAKYLATNEDGSLDVDRLHQMAGDEIKNEVQPFLEEKKAKLGDMFDEIQHAIAPRAGAQRSTLDSVFDLAGDREQHNWTLDNALQPVRVAFDKLPQEAQVDFVDRYKAGEDQATPEMQSVDDFMRKTDADTYRNIVDTQAGNLDPKAQKLWAKMPEADKQSFLQQISNFKADDTLPAGPLKLLADGLLNFKDDHYRVLWKEIPKPLMTDADWLKQAGESVSSTFRGDDDASRIWSRLSDDEKLSFVKNRDDIAKSGGVRAELAEAMPEYEEGATRDVNGKPGTAGALGRRPLQGSQGFRRQSTLDSMSEGLERGGVPVDYNPVRMFELAQADSWRYITAQRMWQDAAEQGARVYVKRGSPPPDGFNFVNDRIGNVSFPAKSGEGNIPAGKWAMRDDYARLLTNMLSHDYIRESAFGNGLMSVKNMLTMYRLSLSPFHAFTTTVSGMASNLNRGITGVYDAARLGDTSLAGQGLKDILRTPISPIQDYKLGSDVVNYAGNKAEFLKTMRGQDFIKQYPDANRLVDDLFSGGAKLGLHEDERVSAIANLRKALAQDKPLRAAWNAPLAATEKLFQPLFSYYIPRLKVATWLRDYSYALVDRAADLDAGKTTRGELARKTWDSVDNMYGQMNWDARYWSRTFKSTIQLAFRAFTWFAGNVRMVKDAGVGQVEELGRSAKFLADRSAGRPTDPGATALPRLDPNLGKIVSLLALTAAGNTALQFATGNGAPNDWKDLMAARIGKNKDGSPMRVTIPAIVVKDGISAAYGGVGNYLKAKASDLIGGLYDVTVNRDFRDAMIHHPEDSWWTQRYADLKHIAGTPIGVATALRARELGGGTASKVLGSAGFAPAPKEIDMSSGAIAARDFVRAYTNSNAPSAAVAKGQQTHELKIQHENGSLSAGDLGQMRADGEITKGQAKKVIAPPVSDLVKNFTSPVLTLEKALDYWPEYSPEEQRELRPFLLKRASTIDRLDRTPLQKQLLRSQVKAALAK